jgi:tRNA uridine 5-carboxymethylaminomethyl modification enzyme
LQVTEREQVIIGRDQGYLGVLVDDLVNLGAKEPYRMFTSRAEYRLLLREDNADQRLSPIGREVGLLTNERWQRFTAKCVDMERGYELLRDTRVSPGHREALERLNLQELKNGASLEELLRRPEISLDDLGFLSDELVELSPEVLNELETEVKYAGYIRRQREQVERFRRLEDLVIPKEFDYATVHGLSAEVREKLQQVSPRTLGQAGRIPGVTPAATAILAVVLKR